MRRVIRDGRRRVKVADGRVRRAVRGCGCCGCLNDPDAFPDTLLLTVVGAVACSGAGFPLGDCPAFHSETVIVESGGFSGSFLLERYDAQLFGDAWRVFYRTAAPACLYLRRQGQNTVAPCLVDQPEAWWPHLGLVCGTNSAGTATLVHFNALSQAPAVPGRAVRTQPAPFYIDLTAGDGRTLSQSLQDPYASGQGVGLEPAGALDAVYPYLDWWTSGGFTPPFSRQGAGCSKAVNTATIGSEQDIRSAGLLAAADYEPFSGSGTLPLVVGVGGGTVTVAAGGV